MLYIHILVVFQAILSFASSKRIYKNNIDRLVHVRLLVEQIIAHKGAGDVYEVHHHASDLLLRVDAEHWYLYLLDGSEFGEFESNVFQ